MLSRISRIRGWITGCINNGRRRSQYCTIKESYQIKALSHVNDLMMPHEIVKGFTFIGTMLIIVVTGRVSVAEAAIAEEERDQEITLDDEK